MKNTTLHIKNMVCLRCIVAVREALKRIGVEVQHVELGYAEIGDSSHLDMHLIEETLKALGFELIHDKEKVLVEEIKVKIKEHLQYLDKTQATEPLSLFLSKSLGKNYGYLSNRFSKLESRTIEKYMVLLKIERVKELLDYGELTLSEIATKLGYSSVHYLSAQFKKVTGVSVTHYKKNLTPKRKFLDDL
ncbi:AraC family transcriptional regulator [Catalinimonas niigatensis]|uniref:AraC family transcriptional regulator n=1 Tax=Catalinimonas niigatensis TaxID=1397264 RepID=UPI0026661B1F|nr:AraC family transcriptional regulator [Catalinimonas niigatensis]WPP51876.1 AraC family transcriptional regulator [Catalinimonas niigatensis]